MSESLLKIRNLGERMAPARVRLGKRESLDKVREDATGEIEVILKEVKTLKERFLSDQEHIEGLLGNIEKRRRQISKSSGEKEEKGVEEHFKIHMLNYLVGQDFDRETVERLAEALGVSDYVPDDLDTRQITKMLNGLAEGDLEKVMDFASENSSALYKIGSDLEFKLTLEKFKKECDLVVLHEKSHHFQKKDFESLQESVMSFLELKKLKHEGKLSLERAKEKFNFDFEVWKVVVNIVIWRV